MMTWQEYFKDITRTVAQKSKCPRRKVGCILVKDKRIIATGYNGCPSGFPDCSPGQQWCKNRKSGTNLHSIPCVHAEQNAIVQCAKFGVSTEGAICYVTTFPCNDCIKVLIQAGIREIKYGEYYKLKPEDEENRIFLLENSKLKVEVW